MNRKYLVKTKLEQSAGVYIISCSKTNKVYIGESLNISNRIRKHFYTLRKNIHSNIILQNIFNKYGEESMCVDILEYIKNSETYTKQELDLFLKVREKYWQSQYKTMISLDKNSYAWILNATEEQKKANKEQLDSIRDKAIKSCQVKILVYNIKSDESFITESLKEATQYVEEKHIYRNIKDKVYLPYNNYVCFVPEEFDKSKILITSCKLKASISDIYYLYDILNNKTYKFPSKYQAAIFLSGKRNDLLYDKYSTFIDNKFITAIEINSEEQLWNTDFVFHRSKLSIKTMKLSTYYEILQTFKNKSQFGKLLNITKGTVNKMLEDRSIKDRIQDVNNLIASYKKSI